MIALNLYLELLSVGLILLVILFINNIFLYKRKLKDRISLLLIFGIAMSLFEILWSVCGMLSDPGLSWLYYTSVIGYSGAFMIFAAILDLYLITQMGIRVRKPVFFLVYVLVPSVVILLYLTTPLTHLLVWVDENGVLQVSELVYVCFVYLLMAYLLAPTFIGFFFLTLGRKKRPADGRISGSAFVFGIMVIALYYLQMIIIDAPDMLSDAFITVSLPVSIGLVYLITNVSTNNALEAQARIAEEKRERDRLQIASERALAASEAKSAFLSNMSHEIRTPINAVLGMNEMILRECNDNDILAYSESIKTAGNTLLGIVNDILDFSKIEAGKMEIIPVDYDLSSIINDLVNMIQTKADDKGLKLILEINSEIPRLLNGDEIRIKQVITNILTNAVKYTEKGSVTLKLGYEKIADEADRIELFVSVADTGIGIKPEDLKKLFSEFDRIEEERNRHVEGTGLGMSITKRLLEMMDSSLEVESEYGVGSTFSFKLKQTVVGWEAIGDYEASYRDYLKNHTKYRESFRAPEAQVLIVDDNEMNLTVFQSLLKQTGVKIDLAVSGDEGLTLAYDKKYDLIFLDHMMPGKDGIETLNELHSRLKGPNLDTPTICLTANAISGAREQYIEAGFDDYLTKPIDSEKLEQLMIKYLPENKVQLIQADVLSNEDNNAEELPAFLLAIDSLDTDAGITNSGGAPAYLDNLKLFAKNVKKYTEDIDNYTAAGDIKNATVKIHALKSSLRIIGASELGELAQKLEDAGKAEDMDFLASELPVLLEGVKKLGDELSGLLEEDGDAGTDKPEIPKEELMEAYSRIKECAEDCDDTGIEDAMEALVKYALPEAETEKVTAINTALENFDFDGIVELLS